MNRFTFASLGKNKFNKSYQVGDQLIQVDLKNFVPNPASELIDRPEGSPMLKVVITGGEGREEYFLKYKGCKKCFTQYSLFNFGNALIRRHLI